MTDRDERRRRAEDLLTRFLSQREAGTAPDREAFLDEHADLRDVLEQLLDDNAVVRDLVGVLARNPDVAAESESAEQHMRREEFKDLFKGSRIGRYRLQEEVGRGGMGVVWRAFDLSLREVVALKFLPEILARDKVALRHLRDEAKVLLSLTHLNIVRLRTFEEDGSHAFLVMEYLAGANLLDFVESKVERGERGIQADEALWILEQVAPALGYAHGEGVTHRDIKPANMMLDRNVRGKLGRRSVRLKLTDFGLAFVANSTITQKTGLRPTGTLPYMAPEVLMGKVPTRRADVYSLGATLYAMVAGAPPFAHGDVITQILNKEPPPLESGDTALDDALAAAMSKDPARRPADAASLLALARGEITPEAAAEEVVDAERPADSQPKPARARRAAAVAVVAALGAGGWLAWSQLGRAEASEDGGEAVATVEPALPAMALAVELGLDENRRLYTAQTNVDVWIRAEHAQSRELVVQVGSERGNYYIEDDRFVVPVGVAPGSERKVTIPAVAGMAAPYSFWVVHDATPPELTLGLRSSGGELEPFEGGERAPPTAAEHLRLACQLSEKHLARVTANGTPLKSDSDGLWTLDVPLVEGSNEVVVEAVDRAGAKDTHTVHITRDSRGPGLSQIAWIDGDQERPLAPLTEGTHRFALDFDEDPTTFDLQGARITIAGRRVTAEIDLPPMDGSWSGHWRATDALGNTTSQTLEVSMLSPKRPEGPFRTLEYTEGWNGYARKVLDERTGIAFVLIDPGSFTMGSPEHVGRADEHPAHEVPVTAGYYLATTETTVAQWRAFVDESDYEMELAPELGPIAHDDSGEWQRVAGTSWKTPRPGAGFEPADDHPVTQVTWFDAVRFADHYGYRLPTEIEWEFACRAGRSGLRWWGDAQAWVKDHANFREQGDGYRVTAPVGSFAASPIGCHDMLGNVWEWCADHYDNLAYADGDRDAVLIRGSAWRVLRGGSWLTSAALSSPARRAFEDPAQALDVVGFRVVLPLPETRVRERELSATVEVETERNSSEGLLGFDGDYVRVDKVTGARQVKARYTDGQRSARWTEYADDGSARTLGNYDNGRRSGLWRRQDGDLPVSEGRYREGWRVGHWDLHREPNLSGAYGHERWTWNDGGTLRAEGQTLDDQQHGAWTFWWPNGQVWLRGEFEHGRRTGSWQLWHADGTSDDEVVSGDYGSSGRGVTFAPLDPEDLYPVDPSRLPQLEPGVPHTEKNRMQQDIALWIRGSAEESQAAEVTLLRYGRDAVPLLLNYLAALDLHDPVEARQAEAIHTELLSPIFLGHAFPWTPSTEPGAPRANGLTVLRWHTLWGFVGSQDEFWTFELRAMSHEPTWSSDAPLANTLEWLQSPDTPAPEPARRSRRRTGGSGTAQALTDGLQWLVNHQAVDGSWDCDGFDAACGAVGPHPCGDPGGPDEDIGVTSLALLALLGDGSTVSTGPHADTVARGIAWLVGQQNWDTGRICHWVSPRRAPAPEPDPDPEAQKRMARPQSCGSCGDEREVDCSACVNGNILGVGPCGTCGADGLVRCTDCPTERSNPGGRSNPPSPTLFSEPPTTPGIAAPYHHALATLALCKAAQTSRSVVLRRAAQSATNYLLISRNPYAAWRYDFPPSGDNDSSVTGWMVLALRAAEEANLRIDSEAFEGAMSWIEEVSDPATGRVGYDAIGNKSSRMERVNDHYPPEKGEAMTAVGLLSRFLMGQDPNDEPIMEKHARLMAQKPPEWDPDGYGCDMYYWFFGTYAMYAIGGSQYWTTWQKAMEKAVVRSQKLVNDEKGSWDPNGPWGHRGGRVYSTALMTLCLEVYFNDFGDHARRR
jgi:formylglycine-generating enzyme required for sulfatase activity